MIISGHSNTIPNLIRLFGINESIEIKDDQHGDLFTIVWENRLPKLLITHIGE